MSMPQSRDTEIWRARQRLQRFGWPRLQMGAIVLLTGVAGLVASFVLLTSGIESMPLRYPLAILIAYGVFLLQMWGWIRWRGDPVADVTDMGIDLALSLPGSGSSGGAWAGSGGGSGGAGSSASWGDPVSSVGESSVLDVVDGDVEVSTLPVLAVLAIAAVAVVAVVAAGWVVWSAPVLMAELMVDAAIAGGLYRRMRGAQAQGWWWLCVRHTFWPLLGVIGFFVVFGGIAQWLSPGATTLMEAVRAL
jgi:hypothetical protein